MNNRKKRVFFYDKTRNLDVRESMICSIIRYEKKDSDKMVVEIVPTVHCVLKPQTN